jgi:hypothetical protein
VPCEADLVAAQVTLPQAYCVRLDFDIGLAAPSPALSFERQGIIETFSQKRLLVAVSGKLLLSRQHGSMGLLKWRVCRHLEIVGESRPCGKRQKNLSTPNYD